MENENAVSFGQVISTTFDGVLWIIQEFVMAFYNIAYAISHPNLWLDWSDKKAVMRFVYYGGSAEFFFAIMAVILVITIIGFMRNQFLWAIVRILEAFANSVGRLFAWAGLLMVLQQIVIVFMQRIFTRPDIAVGFGIPLQFDISWFAEELKLYNAMVVCLCVTYTFVQGGHVRVDLIYSAVGHRAKKVIDMFGALFFMVPSAVLIWMYGWYFLWRHLIVPKPSASDTLDKLMMKSRAMRWNVETIGFSPNGFTGYFLFKILLVAFTALIFIQAIAFFYRSYLEWKEGPESEGKFLDIDNIDNAKDAEVGVF
ncbi:MAG: TRAP transporter small permease subunit [Tateyamaria sp.]|nr:TRAP transporter small permease subunit [Tateyamaria sp.]MDG1680200.1 TRAP transporter small permease subunit [Tateyamaria sp.]MDG2378642.1 TRAP transporter small permease subunit [Tateyamaria sp.]